MLKYNIQLYVHLLKNHDFYIDPCKDYFPDDIFVYDLNKIIFEYIALEDYLEDELYSLIYDALFNKDN